jgi:hypothetical protein
MNEQEHDADILRRMEIAPLHAEGSKGEGVSVAVIDSGLLPSGTLQNLIAEDVDFTGKNEARYHDAYHGQTVAECVNLVAPEARLGNFRVIDHNGRTRREWVIAALQHCIDVFPKYRVANLSVSFAPNACPDECPLCRKVTEAYYRGIYVVVAAGNKGPKPGTITCPALAHWAVVSQATWSKAEAVYWEKHPMRRRWAVHVTGEFAKWYGTSYSAAYASGAAAVHLSSFPKLTAATLRHAVMSVAQQMRSERRTGTLSHKRVRDFLLFLRGLPKAAIVELPGSSSLFLEDF